MKITYRLGFHRCAIDDRRGILFQYRTKASMAGSDFAASQYRFDRCFGRRSVPLAQVKILYPANLILKLEPVFLETPVRATFDVTATVEHSPENASFDSTGQISIMLPQGYELISEKITLLFNENEKVTWKVRAPVIPGGIDTILVYIRQVPHDKDNPIQLARVSVDSAFLLVEIVEVFIKVMDVAIIELEGAMDDTISTHQL